MIDYRFAVWSDAVRTSIDDAAPGEGSRYVYDTKEISECLTGHRVVSPQADAQRIDELVVAGAEQVLLGESALQDGTLVTEAIARHGGERIGVWLPVRRAVVSWGFDTTSNADFSVVAVTNPVPRWVVLRADRSPTDVDALWWAGQMVAAGCASVLVSVAEPEDDDLLACAEMAEIAGERLWLDAGADDVEELRFWARYGQARQLVLPAGCDVTQTRMNFEQRMAQNKEVSCSG